MVYNFSQVDDILINIICLNLDKITDIWSKINKEEDNKHNL